MNIKRCLTGFVLLFMLCVLVSCANQKTSNKKDATGAQPVPAADKQPAASNRLPVRYQGPSYVAANEQADTGLDDDAEEYQIKVGATIRSTGGPQPLWDVMKRLTSLKGMTVSWASDVDQGVLVDVDIAANDNFFEAIAHLLRQADYFHEVQGKTIVVKYKDTKVYQIGLPFMKSGYITNVGGNFLSKSEAASGTEGTVKITSDQNQFDIWDNIRRNLDVIIDAYVFMQKGEGTLLDTTVEETKIGDPNDPTAIEKKTIGTPKSAENRKNAKSSSSAYYTIDSNVGLISVTAPRTLIEKIDTYVDNLKKEVYRQVALEAKIIEVYLTDSSKIGLDWSSILKGFSVQGIIGYGDNGQVYPSNGSHFVSRVNLLPGTFDILINALDEQGETHVLSNPKLTVLNGQPALISVGKDTAYIKTVTKDEDTDNNNVTYSAEVDNVVAGVALGVIASIIDDKKVILHLTPITTELIGGEIPYRTFGTDGLEVGLPEVGIRQMSTMVEVQNGEMLIIGGLIDSVEQSSGSGVPILSKIPVVKYLFGVEEKDKKRRELVILLTPRIL